MLAQKNKSAGFAIIEIVLVVVVVAISGVVGYVFYQKQGTNKTASITSSSMSPQLAAAAGTTASIDELTQKDALAEAGVDTGADTQAQQTATSSNEVINNVEGAYDEISL